MATIKKKAQNGIKTADSTAFYTAKEFKKGGKITKKPCLGCGGKVKSKKK